MSTAAKISGAARISLIAAVAASSLTMSGQLAAALTSTLRPDGDVLRQWSGTPGTAWAALDDPVTQPTSVPATDYIYAGAAGRVTEVALTNLAFAGPTGTVTRGSTPTQVQPLSCGRTSFRKGRCGQPRR
jgi:hypothetical protein